MKNPTRCLLMGALLLATSALLAQIPTGGLGVAVGAHISGATGHPGSGAGHGFGSRPVRPGIVGGFHHRGFHRNRFLAPFGSSAFWWDDGYYPQGGEQEVVQQPAAPAVVQPATPIQEAKPVNPLLIELQGDHFVRLTDSQVNQPLAGSAGASRQQQPELPPAVLVFRDGHRQEVSSYSIIGPVLYASGSYWTNGYWTQKVRLADLDLSATLHANQERGVNFVLPSAPDQVVTRP